MLQSKVLTKYAPNNGTRLTQGDILSGVAYKVSSNLEEGYVDVAINYCVVMTQDCDLEQDFNALDTQPQLRLPSILICPAYPSDKFLNGDHVIPNTSKSKQSDLEDIEKCKRDRYHYLPAVDGKLPSMVIDFKHFYTLPRSVAYNLFDNGSYIITINELFRERLSQRFANYLSRFALPEIT
jgi:hypothetical protein